MLRLIFSAAVGALVGAAIAALVGPPGAGIWVLAIALPIGILSVVFTRLGASGLASTSVSQEDLTRARAEDRLGVARIDAVRQTGTQINDQPLCEIDVTVQPRRGAAYATTLRSVVPLIELGALTPDAVRPVAILIEGGPEFGFVDGQVSPQEIDGLVVPPRGSVPTIAWPKAQRVVNGARRGPLLGIGPHGRVLRGILFIVVALAVAAAVVAPYSRAVVMTVQAAQEGRIGVDLRRPYELAVAVQALKDEIGHDRVSSVLIRSDFIRVEAPLMPGGTETDVWMYRGGIVEHDGAAPSQPDLAAEQFSWKDIALSKVWALMGNASAESGFAVGDASAVVSRGTDSDIESETFGESVEAPEMFISLRTEYKSASFRVNADGSGDVVAQ
ncbi:hypothetical protein [Microbacterium oleivorans]|uniref:Uncharacterized protein n=1 Tax=Microbacterium oleivorans TaxID=273677 RepID=A0A4R5YFW3_9MICO|nr:hypothetical protein [Microbacterium oleivorans]TDL43178.1 hypothetical protein E2R54_08005 [Microbacterium oleivorans]